MKYRLVELLQCPSHPELMLRVVSPIVGDVFPCAGEFIVPVCRVGCGYLSNWFIDIPASLPSHHRFDCRKCMGMEIDSATIGCPECDWSLEVRDGMLQPEQSDVSEEIQSDHADIRHASQPIWKFLALQPGEIVLNFLTVPEALTDKWGMEGVERLQVELSEDLIALDRAKSCAEAKSMAHYLRGPLDLAYMRPGLMDGIIMEIPTEHLENYGGEVLSLLKLLKPSGRAVLVVANTEGKSEEEKSAGTTVNGLTGLFDHLSMKLRKVHGMKLIFVEHVKPEKVISLTTEGKDREGA